MKRGQHVPPATLHKAFRAYLDLGTIAAAALAVRLHPKTLARHARQENWRERRARILREAAALADTREIERLAEARLHARYKWTQALAALDPATTTEGLLAIIKEMLRHDPR